MTRLVRTLALVAAVALVAVPSAAGYAPLHQTGRVAGASAALADIGVPDPPHDRQQHDAGVPEQHHDGDHHVEQRGHGTGPVGRDDDDRRRRLHQGQLPHQVGQPERRRAQEVVLDSDGSILTDFGLAPAVVNGFGESGGVIHNGEAEIQDMYLLINGQAARTFDRQATEIHELGHTLGLAHSTVGFAIGKDGALSPEVDAMVPTMHPFSIATNDRQSLEADDEASLSELYPEASFATTTGTITGTVTRCGSGDPVLGANVRAVNAADPSIQLTQVTGIDGEHRRQLHDPRRPARQLRRRRRAARGRPPVHGRARVHDACRHRLHVRVPQRHRERLRGRQRPDVKNEVPVGASGIKTADFKVEGSSLALVIDETASMGPEIAAIETGLEAIINGLQATGVSFPKTTIVTFDDGSQLRTTTRDPDRLLQIIHSLSPHSTSDCPEGSNRALMTAARQLGAGGTAILVTDADSHRTGPSRRAVEDFYRAKGLRLNTMLSGSCPPAQNPPLRGRTFASALAPPPLIPGAGPDEDRPPDTLGVENALRTFSEESLQTGGLFSFQPEVKTGPADAKARYSNTLANLGISAVRPALAAVNPATVPQGSGLDVELAGSHTSFRSGSTVAISGADVTASAIRVQSPTLILVRLTATGVAASGFRDVTVSTPRGDGTTETATGLGAVEVVGPPAGPTVLSVTPSTGAVGSTEDVTISGGASHFGGTSVASFINAATGAADGVTVNHLTVTSPTSAVANITIAPGAAIGVRSVSVQTGGENANNPAGHQFLVTPPAPAIARLTGASPAAGVRGATIDVALSGAGTAFASGTSLTTVSGPGVKVLSTTVSSPTSATARLQIAPTASLGFRDLTVATGAESAALLDGFEVKAVLQGGGNPPPTTCSDQARPRSSLLKGKKGAALKHHKLKLRGHASDDGCTAAISVAGKVARVEVAISRKAGKKCRFVASSGKLGSARKCSKPVFLKAKGTTTWNLGLKRKLPHAKYTILVRARDAAGNLQATAVKRTVRL